MYLLNLSWAKLKFLKNRQISITKQFNKTIIYPSNNKTYIVDSSSTIMAVHPQIRSYLNCLPKKKITFELSVASCSFVWRDNPMFLIDWKFTFGGNSWTRV
jgi:hypothetical protein